MMTVSSSGTTKTLKKVFVWGCGEDYQLGVKQAKRALDFCIHQPTELVFPFSQSCQTSPLHSDASDREKDDEEEEEKGEEDFEEIERLIAGSRNSCVLTKSKELYSWGWNSHDTLGLGGERANDVNEEKSDVKKNNKEFVKTPTKATYFAHDTTEELEQLHIKDEFVASEIVRVALGGWHALAIDQFGRVHAWGGNEYGQCATEKKKIEEKFEVETIAATTTTRDTTTAAIARDEERKRGVVIDDRGFANTSISTPITIPLDWKSPKTLIKAKRVACGGMSSFAVTVDGDVYSWGCPVGGVGPNTYHPKKVENLRDCCEIAAGSFHVLALAKDGTVYSWGHGEYGQLGHQKTGNEATPRAIETLNRKGVVKIRAGGWHSACITAGGQLLTWGRGEYARLGMGDDDCADKITPTEVKFPSPTDADDDDDDESKRHQRYKIVDASLGGSHTIALTSQGQLLSWGRNSLGRLGRVVNGPHSGIPGEVKFPPLPNERKWICVKLSCGGRHNMALCVETKTKEERERALRAYFNNDNNIR